MHKDFFFLCPAPNEVLPLAQPDYLALIRREQSRPEYAGRQIRLAILYVAMEGNQPRKAVNATHALLDFDGQGYASPHGGNFSQDQNHAFWQAVAQSSYDDVDDDPQVQKLRQEMHDEFSWMPSEKEQRLMLDSIFHSEGVQAPDGPQRL